MWTILRFTVLIVLLGHSGGAWGSESIHLKGTFESRQIQDTRGEVDGFFIQTIPEPQLTDEWIGSGSGGFGPDTAWDTRVVPQELVNGELVLPRNGDYFLRSAIYYDKNYQGLNDGVDSKPRQSMVLTNPSQRFEFDEEIWLGFSIFLPSSWEHEQGVNDHRGGTVLFASNAGPSATFLILTQYVPEGESKAHWFLKVNTSDSTATEDGSYLSETINLGSVEPDLGKWTDFVIRGRVNPFAERTNPAEAGIPNSIDHTYDGNRGILQLWKSGSRSRSLELKIDRVDVPVGLVPYDKRNLAIRFQMYKYGWRRNPTTVKGPIWVGFDEIRFGSTERHGTGFLDVAPDGEQERASAPEAPKVEVD